MKIRVIKIQGCKTCKEVLLYLDETNRNETFVKLVAWHRIDGDDVLQTSEVDYSKSDNDRLMNERIIADFTESSANEFANLMSNQ